MIINYVNLIIIFIFVLPFKLSSNENSINSKQVITFQHNCTPGSYNQPNGPFSILVFCEDALGDYIALYYKDNMGGPYSDKYPKWSLEDRIWQDNKWGSDVTGFAWSPSGNYLYISTSEIYGEGGIFEVNLINRTYYRIYPIKYPLDYSECSTEILGLNDKTFYLKFNLRYFKLEKEINEIHYIRIN